LCLLLYVNAVGAAIPDEDRPRDKTPKVRTVDELQKIRKKNLKKIEGDVEGVLKFRSADFDQQYFIGGEVQAYAQNLLEDLIGALKDDFPEVYQELNNRVNVYVVYDRSLNAHATRSNNILVTSQWIMDAESEGEIVSLLAHELAHIIL